MTQWIIVKISTCAFWYNWINKFLFHHAFLSILSIYFCIFSQHFRGDLISRFFLSREYRENKSLAKKNWFTVSCLPIAMLISPRVKKVFGHVGLGKQSSLFVFCSYIFSSPEPSGSQGELIVYPWSGSCHTSSVIVCSHFQTSSPLKPLDQSKPNFMWSLLGKGERKFI